ncbi:MAG: TolC family protein [Burkholderiales bacterium]|nr:TolC family protein [Burkholderiales bacterium]
MSIRQFPTLRRRLLALLLLTAAFCAQAQAQTLGLAQVLEAARQNLDVSIAQQNLAAAQADVVSADRAPFPIFTAKTSQMYLDKGVSGNQGIGGGAFGQKNIDKSGGIDWTWERGNKRNLRTQSAKQEALAASADLQEMLVMQQVAAAAAYFDLLAARERNQEMKVLSQSALLLSKSAGLRLRAGDLSAQDTARLEIEAQRAQADARSAQLDQQRAVLLLQQITKLSINLNTWKVAADWPSIQVQVPTQGVLQAWVDQRADVVAARERVTAASAALELAQAQKKADVTLGSSLDHDPRVSNRMLELRLSLPLIWGYGYEGEIGRAQAQLAQAQTLFEKTKLEASSDLQRLLEEFSAALERETLYEQDILPRARKVAEQAERAFTLGASSLTDLLDARRTLRATLIEAAFTRADYAKAHEAWRLRTTVLSDAR